MIGDSIVFHEHNMIFLTKSQGKADTNWELTY